MQIFTDEWALAYRDAINAHPIFREAAADWQLGPFGFIARANGGDQQDARADTPPPQDAAVYFDYEKGECRHVTILSTKDVFRACTVVWEASYENWGKIFDLSLNPTTAFLTGKLKVTKGSVYKLINTDKVGDCLVQAAFQTLT